MKKLTFIFVAILLIHFCGFSQVLSNLVFYQPDGFKFFVIMNGIRQNENPETNVKITDLVQPYYKVKIIFDDKTLGEVEKMLNYNPGTETVFQIKKVKSGAYAIRWQSEVPIAQAAPPSVGQRIVVFSTVAPSRGNSNVIQTTTTSTTTTVPPTNGTNVNVGINAGGNNLNMNVNVTDPNFNSNSTTTTTTTTTQTQVNNPPPNGNYHGNHHGKGSRQTYVMPGYNGPIGCPYPMSDNDFANVKQSINARTFEDSKLTIAKQVLSTNCLLTRQVKEIMLLFTFEDSKLNFAKYAYGYTYDIGNYYILNDAFTFESSITELNNYINSGK